MANGAGAGREIVVATGGVVPVRPRNTRWTAAEKAGFLDALAATGNVCRAARSVGRTDQGAHGLRRTNPDFAEGWREALEAANDLLQAAVLEHALAGRAVGMSDEGEAASGSAPCPTCGAGGGRPFDPDLALRVLNQRATRAAAPRQASAGNYRRVSIADVEASLNRKLDTILRGRALAAKRASDDA